MKVLITGGAGFIGSHLAERALSEGWDVTVVDNFDAYYDVQRKADNLRVAAANPKFRLVEADLATANLDRLVDKVDVIFHQAGQPGVRGSWSDGFAAYVNANITVTQRLLEASRGQALRRFVYASSSSVYGDLDKYPTRESDRPTPRSPYGVTKMAAEHLCSLYAANFGVPTTSLRYFTVYGPRQRPDMATHRLIEAALNATPFPLYGSLENVRDFTYVDDIVEANILAATTDTAAGTVVNIAGGSSVTLGELVATVADAVGGSIEFQQRGGAPGDVRQTGGSTERAAELLGWSPKVGLYEGVARQVAWHRASTDANGCR